MNTPHAVLGHSIAEPDPLVAAALRRAKLPGAVATVTTDYPAGAGLGGSSACGVALAGALAALRGEELSLDALASRSRETEVDELKRRGRFPGPLRRGIRRRTPARRSATASASESLMLPPRCADDLARRGVLLYSGESRLSGNIIDAVRDAYERNDPKTCSALARMKVLAGEMAAALRAGDLDCARPARRRALGAPARAASVHHDAAHRSDRGRGCRALARSA